jgi:hypothetical protein
MQLPDARGEEHAAGWRGLMSNVIEMSQTSVFLSAPENSNARRVSRVKTTADYRRLLGEMRLRPVSQRAFLSRLLKRAAANGVPLIFPVVISAATP